MKPILFVVGLSLLGTLSVVQAQEAPLSEAERTAVIADLTTLLNDRYVIPEMADRLESLLRHKAEQGAYADLTDRATFAQTLTHDLQDLSNDKHLRVSYGEIGAAVDSGSPRRVVRRVPGGTGSGGAQPVRRVGGGGTDGGVFNRLPGIGAVEVLPGNVGYVPITAFRPLSMDEEVAREAMAIAADTDALIFDLRACRGGTPEMVHFITSYLFGPEPFHLLTYFNAAQAPDSAYTLAEVPGRRLPETDVYILTSSRTASGGEEFTYNLKHHGRATVVGQTTAGAGHGGGVHPVGNGFNAFIPDFRPVHPVTGQGWEGVGVNPHLEVAADLALATAHRTALEKRLGMVSDPEEQQALRRHIADLEAELAEAMLDTADLNRLQPYAGRYEIRTIFLESDGLYIQRQGGPKLKLVPVDGEPETYTLREAPAARIKFVRDGDGVITELNVLTLQGVWEVSKRDEG